MNAMRRLSQLLTPPRLVFLYAVGYPSPNSGSDDTLADRFANDTLAVCIANDSCADCLAHLSAIRLPHVLAVGRAIRLPYVLAFRRPYILSVRRAIIRPYGTAV